MNKLLWIMVTIISLSSFAQVKPVLNNFRVVDSYKDRVYFDVEGDISGLSTQGFVISGKTITGVNTSSNYFTVSNSFTYWDNNTIRLGENSDDTDVNSGMHNFSLQYIKNNISEPSSSINRYVSATPSGLQDGSSEANAASLSYAISNSKPGDTWWCKAGNYGSFSNLYPGNGTADHPIKFIGYKNTIGDITSMYYNYGDGALNTEEMPTSVHPTGGVAFMKFPKGKYIIVKNFQVDGYGASFYAYDGEGVVFDNCIAKDNNIGGYGFVCYGDQTSKTRFTNGISINGNATVWMLGNHSLVSNMKSYGNLDLNPGNGVNENVNYYYALSGDNNIMLDNYAERDGNLSHYGHGASIHSINVSSTRYNLIEDHSTYNISKGIELRHGVISNNVVRGAQNNGPQTGGVLIRDGAYNNIVENSILKASVWGGALQFVESVETGVGLGHDNIIKNCVITSDVYNNVSLITVDGYTSAVGDRVKFYNNTFYNTEILFNFFNKANTIFTNCEFTNNIFDGITYESAQGALSGWSFDYNNFHNGFAVKGTNYKTENPNFEDKANGNFKLKSNSPLINQGINKNNVKCDLNGNLRPQGSSNDIGAFEYQDNSTSIINANAGKDQTICQGETVTLTASGGKTYQWSNGETSESITVSPDDTTTYTVTASDGDLSDTDQVIVTVNSVKANAGSDVIIDEGKSVTLTASGGDSYSWDNGATTASITVSPTSTKTYSVTVIKNGCEDTDSVEVEVKTITSAPAPVVTANAGKDQTICQGETVTLTASGGKTYQWSNGETSESITVSPDDTTTYTVTASDGDLSDTDQVIVTVNSVKANAGSDVIIDEGKSVTLTASGGDSYSWDNGATTASITVSPTSTKTYSVTVIKNGCEDTDSVEVEVKTITSAPAPVVTANAGKDQTICQGETVTLTASGGKTYQWSNGETSESITVSPDDTTTYTVIAYDGDVSDSDSVRIKVENCNEEFTVLEEEVSLIEDEINIEIYPNPTSNILNININEVSKDLDLHFINITGSILYQGKATSTQGSYNSQIDTSNFTKGIYYLRLYNDTENFVKKIVVI